MATQTKMFCELTDLKNEAGVEALFVDRLLNALDYPDHKVKRKESIDQITIGRGSKKENYKPDYVLLDSANEPIIVIDAKAPDENPEDYHYQVSSYALYLNQKYANKNPVRYVIVTNAHKFIVYPWDSETPIFYLQFEEFQERNEKWLDLRANLSYLAFNQINSTKDIFKFEKPELTALIKKFNDVHNLIRKKDSLSPTDAFYEFSKIMFIKIREDANIHKVLRERDPAKEDFVFSTNWIDGQSRVEANPFDTILFRHVRDELELKIQKGEKKRIFETGEILDLKASTIYEIVRELQNFDLYGIDEDLNGRMFETFLNATVRGKELGQFFTPRSVVHYMVETAPIRIYSDPDKKIDENIPYMLDGCCGSGGFLIDAMAFASRKVDELHNLSSSKKEEYKKAIQNRHLYGVDSNEKIARIARLNMYLHGDGGSKIFKADSLDKHFTIDPGVNNEEREGILELQKILDGDTKIQFDVILTNPPFSISYKEKDANEKRILEQYTIAKKSGKISASENSNVLFIERYKDVLKNATKKSEKDGNDTKEENAGELLTIIDDTVLNGEKSQKYRNYISENFIIVQVVSLPFNTFFRAQANIKTSMIHLRRKRKGDTQGDIFMAITNNIGHDDHQKDTPSRDNLKIVAKYFHEWQKTGKRISEIIHNEDKDEPLGCPLQIFTVPPEELNKKRFDAFYYSPELKEAKRQIISSYEAGEIDLKKGSEFRVVRVIKKRELPDYQSKRFKYFEIGNVTIDGTIVSHIEDGFENLPTRGRLKVQENDVLFAKNNSSRGTTVIIPSWFSGNLVTTGFIGIRPKDYDEALILWSILESEFFRKQVYYLSITASQPEVRDNIFKNEMLIPYPKTETQRTEIIEKAKLVDKAKMDLQIALNETKDKIRAMLFK
ncbi:MAG: N-6 DNA methylase [Methanothrix sp.]|jgi:type I restriction enzyme M protein|uniref:N-6 DNA methylase n=1 Tax=Methanothrix sp. TaxID=90426 RepID=UPI0025D2E4A6|nr:N-6 DNA methylase [Methanothrix sp.]MCK9405650.1 N-6 DNA methylase [Methanothrix sp.]